ncbi:MAG: molybdenum cofactor guanylyltransferase [Gaiella sp.]
MDGGIVLAGGTSSRMGRSKAMLDWEGGPLVVHVCGVLATGVDGPVVVSAAPALALPPLREVVRDEIADGGTLEGLRVGLRALEGRVERAVAVAVDMPLLRSPVVRAVLEALPEGADAAVPLAAGYRQPLLAAYRPSLWREIDAFLRAGRRGLGTFLEGAPTVWLDEEMLRLHDADLLSLVNVNTPADFERARTLASVARE